MSTAPRILTNMTFYQSTVWSRHVTTICRGAETPDTLCPLRQTIRLFRQAPRYQSVVTMGPRVSLLYGLLCSLSRRPSKQIMTEVFLDTPRPQSRLWRAKTALFRRIARRAQGILTNSSGEVALIAGRFQIPEDKLRFVPMYTTIANPSPSPHNDGFLLSIGRTLRDTPTLLAAARLIETPLTIVTGAHDPIPADLPLHITVLRDISLEKSHDLLQRAAAVIIPLLPAERSTGQVVLFEAMAIGKPVIATRAIGITDYIRHNENGLLVDPSNPQQLADAIQRLLADPALASRLASTALHDIQTRHLPDLHARHKLDAIASLAAR